MSLLRYVTVTKSKLEDENKKTYLYYKENTFV